MIAVSAKCCFTLHFSKSVVEDAWTSCFFATFMYPVSSYFEFDAIFSVCRCHLTLHLAPTRNPFDRDTCSGCVNKIFHIQHFVSVCDVVEKNYCNFFNCINPAVSALMNLSDTLDFACLFLVYSLSFYKFSVETLPPNIDIVTVSSWSLLSTWVL